MAEVSDWDPVDDNNDSAPPVGWPEGMMPSSVNNAARAMQGALRREHDRITAGTLSLPYLPLAGGTVTGNVAINGTGGLALGATQLQNISNGLQVSNASGGEIASRGPVAGFYFGDRNQSSPDWNLAAQNDVAYLQRGGVTMLTMNAVTGRLSTNNITGTGNIDGNSYSIGGHIFANLSAGNDIQIWDQAGQVALVLGGNANYYTQDSHQFRNAAGTATTTIDASGNLTAAGAVTGNYLHSTGSVQADNNVTAAGTVQGAAVNSTGDSHVTGTAYAANVNVTGTVQGGFISSTGNVQAANAVLAPAMTASGTVTGAQLTSTGAANIAGTCTAANFVGNFAGGGTSTINTGTATTATINNSGTVNTANLSASSNVTAAGTVTGNSVVSNGTMQVSGQTNLLGTLNVGPSGGYARFDSVGSYNVSGSWLTFSDRAVKQSVTPYLAGLAEIEALSPVSFEYTSAIEQHPVTRYGLMADEVVPVLPEMVGEAQTAAGDTVSTLAPAHLHYVMINAIKELSAKVAALEAQLAAR